VFEGEGKKAGKIHGREQIDGDWKNEIKNCEAICALNCEQSYNFNLLL